MDQIRNGIDRAGLGAAAEDLAAAYLRLRGSEILDRNVRSGGGEIDIVARSGGRILLVEVRLRGSTRFGEAIETIRGRKARALVRAARAWICRNRDIAASWRLDVVTITLDPSGDARVRHYPGAVTLED